MKLKVLILSLFAVIAFSAGNLTVKNSVNSVDKTVTKLQKILKAKGITLFVIIDFRKGAKSVGLNLTDAKLVIFGNPKLGTKIIQKDIKAAIDLPMKVLVYKDSDGKTKIEYIDPKNLEKKYNLAGQSVIPKLSNAMNKITTKAGM
ncbi:MAG: DUF302 domain-containing protein [Epsilonproteobacteria bacterium]|nr:DUF302 domain-containing protein [Campylobacterota bacterium]